MLALTVWQAQHKRHFEDFFTRDTVETTHAHQRLFSTHHLPEEPMPWMTEARNVSTSWPYWLGEGTFHQLHGGTNTNSPLVRQHDNWTRWGSQYASIRGRPYEIARPKHPPAYIGTFPQPMLAQIVRAAIPSKSE